MPVLTGDQRVDLRIGSFLYSFLSESPNLTAGLEMRFGREVRVEGGGKSDLVTRVRQDAGPSPLSHEVVGLDVGPEHVNVWGTDFEGAFDRRGSGGDLRVWGRDATVALDNYLRLVTAVMTLERGGLLLHAAGVIRDGKGYVFFGPHAAGKSTVCSFAADSGFEVFSDDQVVIQMTAGGPVLSSVPFVGSYCPVETVAGQAPLARLFRLHQDSRNWIEPLPRAAGMAMLASHAPSVNTTPTLAADVLAVCDAITRYTPVERLHFQRSADFWQMI